LRALQGLALRLLVAAQDEGPIRWAQIQSDDIPELGLEVLVARKLEGAQHVRLDVVGAPDALYLRRRNPRVLRHRAHAPAGTSRRRLHGLGEHTFDGLGRDGRLASPALGVAEPRQTLLAKASLPQ